jgi:hypothetical protein
MRAKLFGPWTVRVPLCVCLAVVGTAAPAGAQVFESVGTRALGMGGAFVAVADDVTAVYWNPAGLAFGGLVDAALQRTSTGSPVGQGGVPAAAGGSRASTTMVAFAIPSLGVSYLRTRFDQAAAPTAQPNDSRHNEGPGVAALSSLAIDQVGVTLLQSLVANLVVGTTLKLARGSSGIATAAPGAALSAALDQAGQQSAGAVTRLDLDVGVLAFAGPVRVGLVGRNLRRPDFNPGDPTGAGRLQRQVRVGVAFTPGFVVNRTAASQPSLTIALDADLTRATLPTGDERHVAAGVEQWFMGRRVGVRGGVRGNTVGAHRPVATAGSTVAVRAGLAIEAQIARGRAAAGQQWSVGARVTF